MIRHLVNGNAFRSPYPANRTQDGIQVGATLIVPLGVILGLAPGRAPLTAR